MIVISRTGKNVKHPFCYTGRYISMHIKIDEKQKNLHEMAEKGKKENIPHEAPKQFLSYQRRMVWNKKE